MRTEQTLPKSSGIETIILFGSALVTLTFWTKFADPFNPVKLTLILAIARWLTGHLVIDHKKILSNYELRYLLTLISILILSLAISTLNSSVKQVAWVGDYQRNNYQEESQNQTLEPLAANEGGSAFGSIFG